MKRALRTWIPLLALGACHTPPDYDHPLAEGAAALLRVPRDEPWPDLRDEWESRAEILPALENSLAWLRRPHSKRFFPQAGIDHARVVNSLERFEALLRNAAGPGDFQRSLEREFDRYVSAGWDGRGGGVLFTAYCTPILEGSLVPDARFRWPLYGLPDDLVKNEDGRTVGWRSAFGLLPRYPSRAAIEASGLLRGRELVWLADPIDAYLAHVNGSAFIELPDGSTLRLGYAGKNGRPYNSLASELAEDGRISETSLAAIRRWAAQASPEELREYLDRNPAYVFFTPIEGRPHGSLDVEVTPGRTVATDKNLFPRAALVYAAGPPEADPLNRFLFDQDTGGAIRTAGRADLYLGIGPDAEARAGRVRVQGQLYYLFLRE